MKKNHRELHRETSRLHNQLDDDDVIDLTALRQFWNDLDDYVSAGHFVDSRRVTDFDREITAANEARHRLAVSLSDLAKKI